MDTLRHFIASDFGGGLVFGLVIGGGFVSVFNALRMDLAERRRSK